MSALRPVLIAAVAVLALSGCAKNKSSAGAPPPAGGAAAPIAAGNITQLGVNAYLWRASLDVLSFLPLADVEPNGGVIISDWYVNPASPGERIKVTVNIIDKDLRADAVHVSVNRQQQGAGGWVEAPVQAGTVQKLEEAILSKARELRQQQMPSK